MVMIVHSNLGIGSPPDVRIWHLLLTSPFEKSQLTGKDPDAEKNLRQEEKRVAEDEMVGWHHPLNGHGFEQTPGDSKGQGSLACCSPWGHGVKYDLAIEHNTL